MNAMSCVRIWMKIGQPEADLKCLKKELGIWQIYMFETNATAEVICMHKIFFCDVSLQNILFIYDH